MKKFIEIARKAHIVSLFTIIILPQAAQSMIRTIGSLPQTDDERAHRTLSQAKPSSEGFLLDGQNIEDLLKKSYIKGREEGVREAKKIAVLSLLSENVNIDVISKATGFSIEEIEALKSKHSQ
jgi:predicted transposase/invertase (TIGR01784 family)